MTFYANTSIKPLTVLIYEEEARLISNWTLQYPNIETGGDLFGLWQNESEVVIQVVLGPGENCRRHPTSFFQDERYLSDVGNFLTTEEGLCNIGGWHSHHTMNLPTPSAGDEATVWQHLPTSGRFVLLIASIETTRSCPKVSMTFSMFESVNGRKDILKMSCKILEGRSPIRVNPTVRVKLSSGAESDRCIESNNADNRTRKQQLDRKITCSGVKSFFSELKRKFNTPRSKDEVYCCRYTKTKEGNEEATVVVSKHLEDR